MDKLVARVMEKHYAAHPMMSVLAALLVGFGGTLLLISAIYMFTVPTAQSVMTLVLGIVAGVLIMVVGAILPLFIGVRRNDEHKQA